MFHGLINGWMLVKDSAKVFLAHPKLITPLLTTWLIYAPILLSLRFWLDTDNYSTGQVLLIVLGIILVFAFLLSFSCSMLLELIQQLESGRSLRVFKAFDHSLRHNTINILPIILVWTLLWFGLLVIQAILSKDKRNEQIEFSAENAAKALAGYGNISISRAFFASLQKGVRMIIFLILPAIAWDGLNFREAVQKGITIFRSHLSVFVSGFVLTELTASFVFLPPVLFMIISNEANLTFPAWVWFLNTIYLAFAWSYSIYLEQMFVAELYLWNHRWEEETAMAMRENRPLPRLSQIKKPSVLDGIPDLLNRH